MSGNTQGGQQAATPPTAPTAQFTQADIDTARAEGAAHGAQAERERTSAILSSGAAQGRTALAIQCVTTGLTAEQAAAILGSAPMAPAPQAAATNQFAQHMAALGNPKVSGVESSQEEAAPAAVAASWDMAFGIQPGRA